MTRTMEVVVVVIIIIIMSKQGRCYADLGDI